MQCVCVVTLNHPLRFQAFKKKRKKISGFCDGVELKATLHSLNAISTGHYFGMLGQHGPVEVNQTVTLVHERFQR